MEKVRKIKPVKEMAAAMRAEVDSSGQRRKLYPTGGGTEAQQARQESLRRNISRMSEGIRRNRGEVDMCNTEAVQVRVCEYLDACAEAAVFPTMIGMSTHGLGVSRQAVNQWKARHPEHPTTKFLNTVQDGFADLLASAALSGDAVSIPALFALKNMHGWADRYQFEPVTEDHVETEFTVEDIAKRYMADGSAEVGMLMSNEDA